MSLPASPFDGVVCCLARFQLQIWYSLSRFAACLLLTCPVSTAGQLLEGGANVNVRDEEGKTALMMACFQVERSCALKFLARSFFLIADARVLP